MKLRKNRKVTVAVSTFLALVITASATFAWITTKSTEINHFENAGYITDGSVIVGENVGDEEIKPGQEITKEVYVINTGSGSVLARVAFDEMLKVLGNNGIMFGNANPGTSVSAPSDSIPALVNITPYTDTAWPEVTVDSASTVTLPTEVTVRKAAGNDAIIAYYDLGDGTYQSVDLGENAKLTATGTIKLTEAPEYNYFTEGTAEYFSWNVKKNVEAWTWPATINTTIAPAGSLEKSQLSDDLQLIYHDGAGGLATAIDTANAGKWYYNDDGYFYYLGRLDSGTSSNMLLKSIKLLGSAGDEFTKVEYDLAITVESIQATKEALGDATATGAGWQISNAALLAELKSYCPD